jgi:hypothetical protein
MPLALQVQLASFSACRGASLVRVPSLKAAVRVPFSSLRQLRNITAIQLFQAAFDESGVAERDQRLPGQLQQFGA